MHNRLRTKKVRKFAYAGQLNAVSPAEKDTDINSGANTNNTNQNKGSGYTTNYLQEQYSDPLNLFTKDAWSKENFKKSLGQVGTSAAKVGVSVGSNILGNAIAGKHKATGVAGTALGGLSTASDIAIASGNPYLMAAGAAGKILTGVGNRAFGNNQEALAKYDDAIGTMNSFYVSGDYNDIQRAANTLPTSTSIKRSDFGWAKGGDYRDYKDRMEFASAFADNSIGNAVYNNQHNLLSEMYNYDNSVRQSAFGGPLDGPVGYDFMQSYLRNGYLNATKNDRITSMPNSFSMPSTFAFGGNVETGGNTYSTKVTHIDAGGTHEDNPNGGVNVGYSEGGDLNQVEEDEVIYNDYVFSNRLKVPFGPHSKHRKRPKKGDKPYEELFLFPYEDMTYADAAKKIEKKIFGEKGDAMRFDKMQEDQLAHDLQILQDSQEAVRAEKQQKELEKFLNSLSPEELMSLQQNIAASQEQTAIPQAATQIPEGYDVNNQIIDPYAQMPIADAQMAYAAYGGKLFADGGKLNAKEIDAQLAQIEQYAVANNNRELLDSISKTKNLNLRKKKQFIDEFNKSTQQQNTQVEQPVEQEQNVNQYLNGGEKGVQQALYTILKNNPELLKQTTFSPDLAHAINEGYDFGIYSPTLPTYNSIFNPAGNWDSFTVEGWKTSEDPMYLEAVEKGLLKDNMTRQQLEEAFKQTDSYKNTTKLLQDDENARLFYLQQIFNDPNAPEGARNWAAKFVNENGWINKPATYDEAFGITRGRFPGNYWKTLTPYQQNQIAKNFLVDKDGNISLIEGDTSAYKALNSYNWINKDDNSGITYNYFIDPAVQAAMEEKAKEDEASVTDSEEDPNKNKGNGTGVVNPYPLPSNNPYKASLLAAILQGGNALLSGPDLTAFNGLMGASRRAGNYMPISPETISNPYRYVPFDQVLYANNVANAAANSRRTLANNTGLNRGNAAMNILTSDYNMLGNLGAGQLQGLNNNEQNYLNNYAKGTESVDQFNANSRNTVAQANQNALIEAGARQNQLLAQAYDARQNAIDKRDKAISDAISLGLNSYKSMYDTNYANAQARYLLERGWQPGDPGWYYVNGIPSTATAPFFGKNGGKLKRKNNKKSLL